MANKICSNCGKEYQYQVKLVYNDKVDAFHCYHDGEFIASNYELSFVKKQREKYAKDLVQPYNHDGTFNKDFKKLYPNSEVCQN